MVKEVRKKFMLFIVYLNMPKIIEVNKSTTRSTLDKELTKLPKKKPAIDLDKYFGKIKFDSEGLAYQLKVRDAWR
jgi:hypothetical protein